MDSFPPYNEVPQTGGRINSLLLILIFTLFGSGAALIVLRQIDIFHREQIYLATEAALPQHKISAAAVKKNDTSDWKTYRNTEYGFEFMYPEFAQLDENNAALFLGKDVNILFIASPSADYRSYASKTLINGYEVWESKGRGTSNYYFIDKYFERDDFTLQIQFSGKDDKTYVDEFNKIILTFKFTK
jgi:hypothetical protein